MRGQHNIKVRKVSKRKGRKEGFVRCLLGSGKGVSSKRLALVLMCMLYTLIVMGNLFMGKEVDKNILQSLVVLIGLCLGSVATTNFIKRS